MMNELAARRGLAEASSAPLARSSLHEEGETFGETGTSYATTSGPEDSRRSLSRSRLNTSVLSSALSSQLFSPEGVAEGRGRLAHFCFRFRDCQYSRGALITLTLLETWVLALEVTKSVPPLVVWITEALVLSGFSASVLSGCVAFGAFNTRSAYLLTKIGVLDLLCLLSTLADVSFRIAVSAGAATYSPTVLMVFAWLRFLRSCTPLRIGRLFRKTGEAIHSVRRDLMAVIVFACVLCFLVLVVLTSFYAFAPWYRCYWDMDMEFPNDLLAKESCYPDSYFWLLDSSRLFFCSSHKPCAESTTCKNIFTASIENAAGCSSAQVNELQQRGWEDLFNNPAALYGVSGVHGLSPSLVTVLQCFTLEGWALTMSRLADADQLSGGWVAYLTFPVLIVLGGMTLTSLFIAILREYTDASRYEDLPRPPEIRDGEWRVYKLLGMDWIRYLRRQLEQQKHILATLPPEEPVPEKNSKSGIFGKVSEWLSRCLYTAVTSWDCCALHAFPAAAEATLHFRRRARRILRSRLTSPILLFVVAVDAVSLICEGEIGYGLVFSGMRLACGIVFVLEAVLLLVALGIRRSVRDGFVLLDLFVALHATIDLVLISAVCGGIVMCEAAMQGSGVSGFLMGAICAMRSLRLAKVFKHFTVLRMVSELMVTLQLAVTKHACVLLLVGGITMQLGLYLFFDPQYLTVQTEGKDVHVTTYMNFTHAIPAFFLSLAIQTGEGWDVFFKEYALAYNTRVTYSKYERPSASELVMESASRVTLINAFLYIALLITNLLVFNYYGAMLIGHFLEVQQSLYSKKLVDLILLCRRAGIEMPPDEALQGDTADMLIFSGDLTNATQQDKLLQIIQKGKRSSSLRAIGEAARSTSRAFRRSLPQRRTRSASLRSSSSKESNASVAAENMMRDDAALDRLLLRRAGADSPFQTAVRFASCEHSVASETEANHLRALATAERRQTLREVIDQTQSVKDACTQMAVALKDGFVRFASLLRDGLALIVDAIAPADPQSPLLVLASADFIICEKTPHSVANKSLSSKLLPASERSQDSPPKGSSVSRSASHSNSTANFASFARELSASKSWLRERAAAHGVIISETSPTRRYLLTLQRMRQAVARRMKKSGIVGPEWIRFAFHLLSLIQILVQSIDKQNVSLHAGFAWCEVAMCILSAMEVFSRLLLYTLHQIPGRSHFFRSKANLADVALTAIGFILLGDALYKTSLLHSDTSESAMAKTFSHTSFRVAVGIRLLRSAWLLRLLRDTGLWRMAISLKNVSKRLAHFGTFSSLVCCMYALATRIVIAGVAGPPSQIPVPWLDYSRFSETFLNVLVFATSEGWPRNLGDLLAMKPSQPVLLLLIIGLLISTVSIFTLNVLVGIIVENFEQEQEQLDYAGGVRSKMVRRWNEVQKAIFTSHQTWEALGTAQGTSSGKTSKASSLSSRDWLSRVIQNKYVDISFAVLCLLSAVSLQFTGAYAEDYFRSRFPHYRIAIYWFNATVIIVYAVDVALQVVVLRRSLFTNAVFVFDAIVALLSLCTFAYSLKMYIEGSPFASQPMWPVAFRLVRVAYVLSKRLLVVRVISITLMNTYIPLLNVLGLIGLLIFWFALLGTSLFYDAELDEDLHVSFSSFQQTVLLLLSFCTGENFHLILAQTRSFFAKTSSVVIPAMAVLYTLTFVLLAFILLTNLFTGMVLKGFVDTKQNQFLWKVSEQFSQLIQKWRMRELSLDWLPVHVACQVLVQIDAPIGFKGSFLDAGLSRLDAVLASVAIQELPVQSNNKVHIRDVALNAVKRACAFHAESGDSLASNAGSFPKETQSLQPVKLNPRLTAPWIARFPDRGADECLYTLSEYIAAMRIQTHWRTLQMLLHGDRVTSQLGYMNHLVFLLEQKAPVCLKRKNAEDKRRSTLRRKRANSRKFSTGGALQRMGTFSRGKKPISSHQPSTSQHRRTRSLGKRQQKAHETPNKQTTPVQQPLPVLSSSFTNSEQEKELTSQLPSPRRDEAPLLSVEAAPPEVADFVALKIIEVESGDVAFQRSGSQLSARPRVGEESSNLVDLSVGVGALTCPPSPFVGSSRQAGQEEDVKLEVSSLRLSSEALPTPAAVNGEEVEKTSFSPCSSPRSMSSPSYFSSAVGVSATGASASPCPKRPSIRLPAPPPPPPRRSLFLLGHHPHSQRRHAEPPAKARPRGQSVQFSPPPARASSSFAATRPGGADCNCGGEKRDTGGSNIKGNNEMAPRRRGQSVQFSVLPGASLPEALAAAARSAAFATSAAQNVQSYNCFSDDSDKNASSTSSVSLHDAQDAASAEPAELPFRPVHHVVQFSEDPPSVSEKEESSPLRGIPNVDSGLTDEEERNKDKRQEKDDMSEETEKKVETEEKAETENEKESNLHDD